MFSTWMPFTGINKYGKFAVVLLWTVFWPVYHATCERVLWNGTFLDIYLTTSFRVRKFKNASALRVIFFFKMSKIEPKFTKCKKILTNFFRFWDNCMWKICYKLSLLRREYLLPVANGLTNSPKVLHISQRDVFDLNWMNRDQWIP